MIRYLYMHDFIPFFNMPIPWGPFGIILLPFVILLVTLVLILKGYALWHSARAGQTYWFIAILVINTVGILEIVYLLFFRTNAPYKHMVESKGTPAEPRAPTE